MDFPIGHLNEHRPSEDVERRRLGNGPERADVVGAVDRAAHPAEKRPSVGRVDAECVQNAVECLRLMLSMLQVSRFRALHGRSEERRVGKGGVRTCRYRVSADHKKKNTTYYR